MPEHIPVFKPLIEDEEVQSAEASLRQGWLGMGRSVGAFEQALKQTIGAPDRHVVAVSTGHAALHLALMLIDAGPGDEIITPAFNNIADFQAILAVGAKPVFCDIRDDTLCIDLDKAEKLIGPNTKALIVMDYDCCLCDHDRVAELAYKHELRIIHDAAHALGSVYKNKPIGSFSDICMFSFDPVKTITCIDGGALVVRTQEEVEALHEMRLLGMGQPSNVMYQNKRAWTYHVKRLGFRYHMANLHAAIGIAQLTKLPTIIASRREACRTYNRLLATVQQVRTPSSTFEGICPFLYYIRVPAADRDALRSWLDDQGIDTGIHWQPGYAFELLAGSPSGDMTVTSAVSSEVLSLPLHSHMDLTLVERICSAISAYFQRSIPV